MFNIYSKTKYLFRQCVPFRALGFIVWSFVLFAGQLVAQPYSYIYIQGDKITPFYVKLDGQMQPRYGKNHCIVPMLKAGPVGIEILFQQNEYPAEKFTIDVPGSGPVGFLLDKQDSGYVLYDLKKKNYLKPERP